MKFRILDLLKTPTILNSISKCFKTIILNKPIQSIELLICFLKHKLIFIAENKRIRVTNSDNVFTIAQKLRSKRIINKNILPLFHYIHYFENTLIKNYNLEHEIDSERAINIFSEIKRIFKMLED